MFVNASSRHARTDADDDSGASPLKCPPAPLLLKFATERSASEINLFLLISTVLPSLNHPRHLTYLNRYYAINGHAPNFAYLLAGFFWSLFQAWPFIQTKIGRKGKVRNFSNARPALAEMQLD